MQALFCVFVFFKVDISREQLIRATSRISGTTVIHDGVHGLTRWKVCITLSIHRSAMNCDLEPGARWALRMFRDAK